MYIKSLTSLIIIILVILTIVLNATYTPPVKNVNQAQEENIIANNEENISGKQVPNFSFTTIDNKSGDIKSIKNNVIIINFWASWCKPCIEELAYMINLTYKYPGKIALVAVSIDEMPDDITKFLSKLKDTKPYSNNIFWIWDSKRDISLKTFNTKLVPESIIIDNKRIMQKKIAGYTDWKDAKLLKEIESMF